MNTIRKLKKSAKALSPVVASIILIAVTVAVSIAVAAWMGALTFSFTNTEQINITSMTFTTGPSGTILLIANNTGTTPVTINSIVVNNAAPTSVSPALPQSINANNGTAFTITCSVTQGYSYQVKLMSSKGNTFLYTGTAPS